MSVPWLQPDGEGLRLAVQVQPKSSRNEIAGEIGGRLKIRLTAPPVEGKANKALVKFVAKRLGIAASGVIIVGGHKSRRKDLQIEGMSPEEARAKLS